MKSDLIVNTRASFVYKCLTFVVKQDIFWFEVSVNDPLLMEVLQALDDLRCIVTGPRLVKARVVLIHIIDVVPTEMLQGHQRNITNSCEMETEIRSRVAFCLYSIATLTTSIWQMLIFMFLHVDLHQV